jgi:hypothetical protein
MTPNARLCVCCVKPLRYEIKMTSRNVVLLLFDSHPTIAIVTVLLH